MTGEYYVSTSTAVDGTVIDAADLNNQLSAIQAGFDAVAQDMDRAIKVPTGEGGDKLLGAAATRQYGALLFDASGNPVASTTWLANWNAGGHRLTNLGAPVSANDAVTLAFMTTAMASTVGISAAGGPGFLYSNGSSVSWASAFPTQTGNEGKFLATNGTAVSWGDPLPAQAPNAGKYLKTDGATASWSDVFSGDQFTWGAGQATVTDTLGNASATSSRRDYRSAAGAQAYDVRQVASGGTSGVNGKGKLKTEALIQTFTGVFGHEATFALGNLGVTESIDFANGGHQSGTLDADCTITLNAPPAGYPLGPCYRLYLTEDSTGSHLVGWAGISVAWAGPTPPPQPAGATIVIYLDWTGSRFLASWVVFG